MPSPIAHAALGYVVYRAFKPRFDASPSSASRLNGPFLALSVGLSLLPDLDFIPGLLTNRIGDFHNGASHSPVMAVVVALAVAAVVKLRGRRNWRDVFLFVLTAYGIHVFADFLTWGRGTMLLWPLSLERFVPPFHVFYGLHRSEGLISHHHLITLANELLFVVAVLIGLRVVARVRQGRTTNKIAV